MVLLTAALFYGLASGKLYTRSQHESIVNLLKEAAVKDAATIAQQNGQIDALLEGTKTAKDFFDKVPVEGRVPDDTMSTRRRKAALREANDA